MHDESIIGGLTISSGARERPKNQSNYLATRFLKWARCSLTHTSNALGHNNPVGYFGSWADFIENFETVLVEL